MKKVALLIICLFVSISYSQVSFTLSNNACSGTSKTLTAATGTDVVLSYTWSSTPAIPVFSSPNTASTAITFPSSGTFTINLNVSLASGSDSYSTIVNVAASPTILVTQSSPTTCVASNYPKYSQPVYLSPIGASSYIWNPYISYTGPPNPSAIYVRPPVSTCYTVTGIIGNCTASAVICVSVIPQYSIAVSLASRTICPSYDSLQLNVIAISTLAVLPITNYVWYDPIPPSISNPFNPTVTVSPSVSCTYTVEVYDTRACVSLPAFANVSVASCVGIHSNSLDNTSVLIYPNPFTNQLSLNTNTNDLKKLIITNLLGQTVYQTEFYQNDLTLDLQQLHSGAYVAELYLNNKINFRTKLIKQH